MGGNRKHGFMRGNKAGRNGVGQQSSFFCDACNKTHGPKVERTGIVDNLSNKAIVCERMYLKYADSRHKASSSPEVFISKMKRLKAKLFKADSQKNRINFVITAFISGLYSALVSYKLFDMHNIGARTLDVCFEAEDSDLVIHAVIKASQKDYWLKRNIQQQLGVGFERWQEIYNQVEHRHESTQNAAKFDQPAQHQLASA